MSNSKDNPQQSNPVQSEEPFASFLGRMQSYKTEYLASGLNPREFAAFKKQKRYNLVQFKSALASGTIDTFR